MPNNNPVFLHLTLLMKRFPGLSISYYQQRCIARIGGTLLASGTEREVLRACLSYFFNHPLRKGNLHVRHSS